MQTEKLHVTGMTCDICSSAVTKALKLVNGVEDVIVSLSNKEANVRYDERLTTLEEIISSLKVAGYGGDIYSH